MLALASVRPIRAESRCLSTEGLRGRVRRVRVLRCMTARSWSAQTRSDP